MVGSEIRQFGLDSLDYAVWKIFVSLSLVTALRHPNPNPVLSPESINQWNLGKIIEIS